MLTSRILIGNLTHASIAFEKESKYAKAEGCLKRNEDRAEAFDFIECIRLILIKFHKPLHVNWAVHLLIIILIHLNRLDNLNWVPFIIKHRLMPYQHTTQNTLSNQLPIRKINLLTRKIMKHFQIGLCWLLA